MPQEPTFAFHLREAAELDRKSEILEPENSVLCLIRLFAIRKELQKVENN